MGEPEREKDRLCKSTPPEVPCARGSGQTRRIDSDSLDTYPKPLNSRPQPSSPFYLCGRFSCLPCLGLLGEYGRCEGVWDRKTGDRGIVGRRVDLGQTPKLHSVGPDSHGSLRSVTWSPPWDPSPGPSSPTTSTFGGIRATGETSPEREVEHIVSRTVPTISFRVSGVARPLPPTFPSNSRRTTHST